MAEAIAIVLPVFAIILIGYLFGRSGRFGRDATRALTDFTFTLSVPALLFKTVAEAHFPMGAAVATWLAFFGSVGGAWILASLLGPLFLRRPADDMASITVSAAYGNVVMLGIPLSYTVYGAASGTPIAILMSLHTPALWLFGSVHMALVAADRTKPLAETARDLLRDLAQNPIVVAVVVGVA